MVVALALAGETAMDVQAAEWAEAADVAVETPVTFRAVEVAAECPVIFRVTDRVIAEVIAEEWPRCY